MRMLGIRMMKHRSSTAAPNDVGVEERLYGVIRARGGLCGQGTQMDRSDPAAGEPPTGTCLDPVYVASLGAWATAGSQPDRRHVPMPAAVMSSHWRRQLDCAASRGSRVGVDPGSCTRCMMEGAGRQMYSALTCNPRVPGPVLRSAGDHTGISRCAAWGYEYSRPQIRRVAVASIGDRDSRDDMGRVPPTELE